MAADIDGLPVAEFAFPGPLRDELVAAILAGAKTTTTGLLEEYEHYGDPIPEPGSRQALIDSDGRRIAVLEIVEARVIRVSEVTEEFARAEGEGFETVADWRAGHQKYYQGEQMREALGKVPAFDDNTLIVAEWFRLVERR
jgi:uncharacterized protein YhfF